MTQTLFTMKNVINLVLVEVTFVLLGYKSYDCLVDINLLLTKC